MEGKGGVLVKELVVAYIRAQYGAEPEYLWEQPSKNAVFRRLDNRKWFGVLLPELPRRTLRLPGEGAVDILNLKCGPVLLGALLDGRRYLPAYHMNKEHWVSILLDGSVPMAELAPLIDLSWQLTAKK